jgi:uncharacterized repeat protein (TIGR03843 family)
LQAALQGEASLDEELTREQERDLLCEGEISGGSLVPWGSNYTYLVMLERSEQRHRAVYKPRRGEAPLIDFPSGTLYLREYATYLTSEWLGWNLAPQTVVRDGPYGIGTVQIYVEAEGSPHVYSLGPEDLGDLQRLVLFDMIINNADRKPAHVFKGVRGGIWAIDHGLTFHARPKLRTVIWDFCGEPIPAGLVDELGRARADQARVAALDAQLRPLLSRQEINAFWRRVDDTLQRRRYPLLDPRYNIPYGFA